VRHPQGFGVSASLVRDQEVGGSNPLAPTILFGSNSHPLLEKSQRDATRLQQAGIQFLSSVLPGELKQVVFSPRGAERLIRSEHVQLVTRLVSVGGEIYVTKSSKLICVAAGLLSLFAGFVFADSFVTRREASNFLRDVKLIRPGVSTIQELLQLRDKYHRFASAAEPGCNQDECTIYFHFYNTWLFRIHAVPPTEFGGGISARRGIVWKVDLALQSGRTYDAQVSDAALPTTIPPLEVFRRESRPGGELIGLQVRLGPGAPLEARLAAYQFNLGCLTQLGGCNDARAMLPKLDDILAARTGE